MEFHLTASSNLSLQLKYPVPPGQYNLSFARNLARFRWGTNRAVPQNNDIRSRWKKSFMDFTLVACIGGGYTKLGLRWRWMSQFGLRRPMDLGRWVMLLPHRERNRRLDSAGNWHALKVVRDDNTANAWIWQRHSSRTYIPVPWGARNPPHHHNNHQHNDCPPQTNNSNSPIYQSLYPSTSFDCDSASCVPTAPTIVIAL